MLFRSKGDEDDDGAVDVDAMDAEIQQDDEEWDGTEEMRKRKLNEYMDEVYGLDFNDIVGFLKKPLYANIDKLHLRLVASLRDSNMFLFNLKITPSHQ